MCVHVVLQYVFALCIFLFFVWQSSATCNYLLCVFMTNLHSSTVALKCFYFFSFLFYGYLRIRAASPLTSLVLVKLLQSLSVLNAA